MACLELYHAGSSWLIACELPLSKLTSACFLVCLLADCTILAASCPPLLTGSCVCWPAVSDLFGITESSHARPGSAYRIHLRRLSGLQLWPVVKYAAGRGAATDNIRKLGLAAWLSDSTYGHPRVRDAVEQSSHGGVADSAV